jgi:hypothetical protein
VRVSPKSSFAVDFSAVGDMLKDLNDARDALNAMDNVRGIRGTQGYSPAGTRMTRELRKQVKTMSDGVIVPALHRQAAATGDRLTNKMARTARSKQDRLPVVKVGSVNPKIAGFLRTKTGVRNRARGALAWGSERGPWGPDAPSGLGKRKGRYARPRNPGGYWVSQAISNPFVQRRIVDAYGEVVNAIFAKWQWGPRSGDVTKAA